MDMNQFRKHLANKSSKRLINESQVPKAVQIYLDTPHRQHTYGTAYDAGAAVAAHPAVQAYHDKVRKTLRSLPSSKANNAAYVKAYNDIPMEVLNQVAKDFGTTAQNVYWMYSSFSKD